MTAHKLTSLLSKALCILIPIAWVNIASGSEDIIRIAIGEGHKALAKNPNYKLGVEVPISEIYKEANIDFEFVYLPNERAIQSVVSGQYDALGLRVAGLDKNPNIIKVDVPLGSFDVYFLSRGDRYVNNLEGAKDETVVALHGARYVDALKQYKKLHLIHSEEQAALMLTKGRADLWLAPLPSYQLVKDTYPEIKISSPVVSRENVYHYIHASQAHQLERLESAAKRFLAKRQSQAKAKQPNKNDL
ncbi:transporter substrate-binding domain-containing protein [Vibrio sp. OCN044]|uniref:Transporter substrate-binding domain-containing protein n=1 Tax=Vibrio tetraodonis subsp. pristinus TaxID=2695891 RepID=A0A6L8LVE3_9VIBR|nr:transporter substrate-binding domain-containing protein [Vibrio tetraodonis]MYM60074.1 transporter substrate-binding domain-containing protein [Vibrio tetraodonis subsp. pristinus]